MKKGLGKGLNALFVEATPEEIKTTSEVSINDILRDKNQPRKSFNSEDISNLAQSIKENGIIQPIIVRKKGNKYIIVAGERRFRAAKSINLKKVPVVIREYTERQVVEIALIENVQRKNLNSIEEAIAYSRLKKEFNMTQEQISTSVGKSRVAVANTLRLLSLNSFIQDLLINGSITEGHGRALLGIGNEEKREKVAKDIISKRLSVREVEKIALQTPKIKKTSKPVVNDEEFKHCENVLAKKLGSKVKISRNPKKGKITIEYYSLDGLNRIIETITG